MVEYTKMDAHINALVDDFHELMEIGKNRNYIMLQVGEAKEIINLPIS